MFAPALLGGCLVMSGATGLVTAQESGEPGRLSQTTLSRLPNPIRKADSSSPSTNYPVRPAAFVDENEADAQLNWRRRELQSTGQSPGLAAPRNAVSQTRLASNDPIDDPFGDRSLRRVPAQAASSRKSANVWMQDEPAPNPITPSPASEYYSDPGQSQRIGCEALSGSSIDQIDITLAPTLFPGAPGDAQQFRRLLRELIGNPVRDWTHKANRDDPQPNLPPVRGRLKQMVNTQQLIILTPDNQEVAIIPSSESFMAAEILLTNVEQDWSTRNGKVVARGWVIDYINDSVVIRTVDGEDVQVRFDELVGGGKDTVISLWNLPMECYVPEKGSFARSWVPATYTWKASALCHKPLYFEDIQLERYGHSAGPLVQPLRSGAHFFLNIAALPYNVGVYPPNECRYALGYYRPGNCAPFRGYALPLSARGAMTATGFYVGAPFLVP